MWSSQLYRSLLPPLFSPFLLQNSPPPKQSLFPLWANRFRKLLQVPNVFISSCLSSKANTMGNLRRKYQGIQSHPILRTEQLLHSHDYIYVGIALRYELKGPRFNSSQGQDFLFDAQRSDRFWSPPSLLFIGYRDLFPPGVKRHWHEADHNFPSSAEVKNGGAIRPIPPPGFVIKVKLSLCLTN
jgi:hypothetical protein